MKNRSAGPSKKHEAGAKVDDLCRELGIFNRTFDNWRSKYSGLEVNEARRLRELESENSKLKCFLQDERDALERSDETEKTLALSRGQGGVGLATG